MPQISVVTSRFYQGEAVRELLKQIFPEADILVFYRDYLFKSMAAQIDMPMLVLTDGRCKTRDENGESVGIWYNEPREFAMQRGIYVISLTTFGFYLRSILLLKLKLFAIFHRA